MGMEAGNKPLVLGHFEAWDFGPVHPLLYQRLKIHGARYVLPETLSFASPIKPEHPGRDYLDAAVTQLDRDGLVAITHWGQGAWARHYRPGMRGIRIPNDHILEEYHIRTEA